MYFCNIQCVFLAIMSRFKASYMGLIAAWSLTADHHLRKSGQDFMI